MRRKKEKVLKVEDIKKILSNVSDFESFWFCNNTVASSLEELSKLLLEIDDTTFRYHLHKNKNDYEDWIKNIIGDEEFSKEISRVKTRVTLSKKIEERVDFLKKQLKIMESKVKRKKQDRIKTKESKKVVDKKEKSKIITKNEKKSKTLKSKINKNSESRNIKNKLNENKSENKSRLQLKKIVR